MREYAERDYDAEISGIENQIRSNQDYYENLGQQIGELSRDKELYDEGEWNSLYDEKAGAQSDAVNKIYELRGQLNDLQAERDGQSTVSQDDADNSADVAESIKEDVTNDTDEPKE